MLVGGYLTLTQTIATVLIPVAIGMIIHLGRRNTPSRQSHTR
jgi:hypothetical protein